MQHIRIEIIFTLIFGLNSVNYETGQNFQQSKKELQEIKDYSDEICLSYGLSIIEKKERTVSTDISMEVYQAAMKGESWKFELINNIDMVLETATSKANFIAQMNQKGYSVLWEDSRKNITFTTPDGKKCRSNKLYDEKYTSERLLYEIKQRAKQCNGKIAKQSKNTASSPKERRATDKHEMLNGNRPICS